MLLGLGLVNGGYWSHRGVVLIVELLVGKPQVDHGLA
jgi:hypothetical protein